MRGCVRACGLQFQCVRFHWINFMFVISAHDGNTYAFSKKKIYKLDENGVAAGFPRRLNQVYRRAPKSASAIVFDRLRQKTFFFKGE